ncbi:MAG: hypothetical protein DI537_38580 [Stutzerimonas stutzeri]|nr:MAG: hypothetical protein DI537_38580 [Stutzerimonas stutzeri]
MAGKKGFQDWKPAKAQHQALTPKQPIPPAKSFRAISALDPVPDQSKMTATQALMVQRMTGRTAPFPDRAATRPEVLEGEILPPETMEEKMMKAAKEHSRVCSDAMDAFTYAVLGMRAAR